VDMKVWSA